MRCLAVGTIFSFDSKVQNCKLITNLMAVNFCKRVLMRKISIAVMLVLLSVTALSQGKKKVKTSGVDQAEKEITYKLHAIFRNEKNLYGLKDQKGKIILEPFFDTIQEYRGDRA